MDPKTWAQDPWYLLSLILGFVYWLQRLLTLKLKVHNSSASKRYIASGIPIFALAVSVILPAGVTLYWLTYATLSVTQPYVVFQHVLSALLPNAR